MANRPAVVIDNGTGYTKMGYAGNAEPSYIVPTCIAAASDDKGGSNTLSKKGRIEDLDFYVGDEAIAQKQYSTNYPVRHGQVENWDHMERFWQRCIFQHLRCEPEEHMFCLTEPPLNAPENREYTAEIMFETFNVRGLYIAVQAVLALAASWVGKNSKVKTLTGSVIDSGDGVTHVIPVVEGYVIGSGIKSMPIAGRDMTLFVQQLMRERGEPIPSEQSLETAKRVKETYSYVCPDIVKEFRKYDAEPQKWIKTYDGVNSVTKQPWQCDVGYERFLAPEIFFSPEIYSSDYLTPLPVLVDSCIQNCPIDTRRALYRNVVLSGGSTMYKDFDRRLQKDLKKMIKTRIDTSKAGAGAAAGEIQGEEVDVNVVSHNFQRFAPWFGGSMLASSAEFLTVARTKAEYDEHGPSICRHSPVFGQI
mmetsp:Transcript_28381/g.66329  ORF Transcript_28381/g.66329 Transcript_28381/m.66329 type:complete len:419 (-) Transcript_28381:120-1376(-)